MPIRPIVQSNQHRGQLVGDVIDRTKRTAMLKASRGADTIEVKAV